VFDLPAHLRVQNLFGKNSAQGKDFRDAPGVGSAAKTGFTKTISNGVALFARIVGQGGNPEQHNFSDVGWHEITTTSPLLAARLIF
jgi:hypothetical protein